MFNILIFLLLIVILVPLLLVAGVGLKIWHFLFGTNKSSQSNRFSYRSQGNRQDSNTSSHRSGATNRQTSASSQNKIFKEGQGEYVDFEEVD
ncbi:MAG: DUF4834 family protein [Bacteroidaceae bacterium]|nr:DUF4834 family protein [Bacteroidaceae bacterium]